MKVKYEKTLKSGRRHVLIELEKAEPMPVEPINPNAFYRTNYPHEQILEGWVLSNIQRVYWESYSQKWEDAT